MPHANVPDEVEELKETLYQMLTVDPNDERDVKIGQKMDVALSPAIKRDGVNIIQLQNVDNRITTNVVEALKITDRLQSTLMTGTRRLKPSIEKDLKQQIETLEQQIARHNGDDVIDITPKQIEHKDPIKDIVSGFFNDGTTMREFLNEMKKEYVKYALDVSSSDKEAAEKLDLQPTSLPGLKKRLDLIG